MTQHMPAKIWATYDGGEWSTARLSNDRLFIRADIAERMAFALVAALRVAGEAREEWDKAPSGMKAGKLLIALSDPDLKYRADITEIHSALSAFRSATQDTEARHE